MALILAIEPDAAQAAQLTNLIRVRLHEELVLAATTEHALVAIGNRVPDLVLTPALLSPQEDAALAGALRAIAAAARVPMLTIPQLVEAAPPPPRTGLLARWRKGRATSSETAGCAPAVFGEQIAAYLSEAAAASRVEKADSEPIAVAASEARPARIESPAIESLPIESLPIESPAIESAIESPAIESPAIEWRPIESPAVDTPSIAASVTAPITLAIPEIELPAHLTIELPVLPIEVAAPAIEPVIASLASEEAVTTSPSPWILAPIEEPASLSVILPEAITEPVVAAAAEPVVEAIRKPVVDAIVEPIVAAVAEPVVQVIRRPVVEASVEPIVEATPEPIIEVIEEPIIEAIAEPIIEVIAEPVVETIALPVAEAIIEPLAAEAIAEPIVEVIVEPTVEAIPEPIAAAIAEPLVAAVTEPAVEAIAKPVIPIAPPTRERVVVPAYAAKAVTVEPIAASLGKPGAARVEESDLPDTPAAPVVPEPVAVEILVALAPPAPTPIVAPAPPAELQVAAAAPTPRDSSSSPYVSQADLDQMFFQRAGIVWSPDAVVARKPAVAAPPPRPEPARSQPERPEWLELIESLRLDIDRLRAERAHPAPEERVIMKTMARDRVASAPRNDGEPAGESKPPRPAQDQWGLFDPDQCGFRALIAKLDEITETNEHANA